MSLIEVWRDRKLGRGGPARPPRLWKMLITLALVVYLILRLNRLV
jgi:hypothetical protein